MTAVTVCTVQTNEVPLTVGMMHPPHFPYTFSANAILWPVGSYKWGGKGSVYGNKQTKVYLAQLERFIYYIDVELP